MDASDPWEGDNTTLKADLVVLSRAWKKMCPGATDLCPVSFPDDESAECLRLEHARLEAILFLICLLSVQVKLGMSNSSL